MPSFKTAVPHGLSKDEASQRMKGLLEKVRSRYGDQVSDLEETWEGDTLKYSFKTYGFKIKGEVEVTDKNVELKGDLPIAAMPFKGRIEQSISEEVGKALG